MSIHQVNDMEIFFHKLEYKRYPDYPRYLYPHPQAGDQGMLFYQYNEEDHVQSSIYAPKAENDSNEGFLPRRAYNLSPYFDLKNTDELYAFNIHVPGYPDTQYCTFLPHPTSHYMGTQMDFIGTDREIPQREHRLMKNKRITSGRVFVSLPKAFTEYWDDKQIHQLDSDDINDYTQDEGTFWIFTWNGKTGYSYNMQMVPVNDLGELPSMQGRCTPYGYIVHDESGEIAGHYKYNLDFLDP